MKAHYEQFIGMYSDIYPDYFCHHMIEEFERFHNNGMIQNRQQSENVRKYNNCA